MSEISNFLKILTSAPAVQTGGIKRAAERRSSNPFASSNPFVHSSGEKTTSLI